MRKADFGAVDDAVSHGFEEDEVVMIYWVEDEALDGSLCEGVASASCFVTTLFSQSL